MTLSPSPLPSRERVEALLTENAGAACKPGSVSRLLGRDGGHLSSPASVLAEAPANRCEPDCGQRCRWGRAANPGTSRTLMVPLFGLAPGGVLAAGASPHAAGRSYRPISPLPIATEAVAGGMFLCHFPSPLRLRASTPGSYPAPCPVEPGLSSPKRLPSRGGHPAVPAFS